ncbi:MAG: uroporphyrinogen decarboxylase family protein [Planctomycetota bacterium]
MALSLADLHRRVAFGEAGGRIIWQPRIGCWFDDRMFSGEGLPGPYAGMDLHEVYRALGCSARLYEYNSCFRRVEHPSVEVVRRELSETDTETTIRTPVRNQVAVHRRTPTSPHPITVKWEVTTREELAVAAWREANATWEWDREQFDAWQAKVGDLGAPTMFMPRMNVQCLYIEKMGVESAVYAIYEWRDEVEAFFRELEGAHDRLIDVIAESPIEIVNFGENVHAGTLSPDLFLEYHLPACQRRCERLHAAGKFVTSHWDGDVGPLLPHARETGLDGIEAITPVPQGDVTLEETREALGDDMLLLDGIPAVHFDETYPVSTLVETAERLIDLFAPKLILGISDEISSTGDIERIRVVAEIVDRYNAEVA